MIALVIVLSDDPNGAHIALAAAVAVPTLMIFGLWFDWRKAKRADREVNATRHHENEKRLVRIETIVEPIVEWFNERRTNGGDRHR
jgi:hypothetical protein